MNSFSASPALAAERQAFDRLHLGEDPGWHDYDGYAESPVTGWPLRLGITKASLSTGTYGSRPTLARRSRAA